MASKGLNFHFFLPGTKGSPDFKKSNFASALLQNREFQKIKTPETKIELISDASTTEYKSDINPAPIDTPRTLIPQMHRKMQEKPCKFMKGKNSEKNLRKKNSNCHLAPNASYLDL